MNHRTQQTSPPTKEEPIDFCNAERYADPTAYYAMQCIVREQREAARSQLRTHPRTRVARYA